MTESERTYRPAEGLASAAQVLLGVSANLHAMGMEMLEFNPGSMIWWWFVPCANLFIPFKAMRELELRSGPEGLEADLSDAQSPLLPAWWGCWVISGILGRAAMRMGTDGPIELGVFVDLANAAVIITCGVLAILVVRRVQALHTQKHASMVEAGQYSGPPLTF